MAGSTIKNVLTLDVTRFTAAIDKATEDLKTLNTQLESAGKAATSFENGVSGLGVDIATTANKFKLLDQTVGSLSQKLNSVANGGMSSLGRSSRSAAAAVANLAASSASAATAATKAQALTNKYNAELERLRVLATQAAAAQAKLNAPARNGGALDVRHVTTFSTGLRHFMMTVAAARFAVLDFYDVFLRLPLAIIKASGEVERMTKLMAGLSTESTQAKRDMEGVSDTKFVFATAKNAPFEVKAISDAFVKLKVAGLDPTRGSLETLLNSVAKFGGTAEHLHRASIAIQQMTGKGVISMEELRQQLGEAIPTAMQAMAKGTGLAMGDLVKKISLGTVEATSALERMFAVLKFEDSGASALMMQTWVGQLEKLKTNWTLFANDVGNTGGFFKEITNQLELLNNEFESGNMREFAHDVSVLLGDWVRHIADGAKAIMNNWGAIKAVGQGLIAIWAGAKVFSAINAITGAFKGLYATVVLGGRAAMAVEVEKVAAINAAAASEIAVKRGVVKANAAANAQMIVQNAAVANQQLTQNRAKLVELTAQEAAHRAEYHAAVAKSSAAHMVQLQAGTYKEIASGKIRSAAWVAENAAKATSSFALAEAEQRSINRINAAHASLLATSTGTMAALRANSVAAAASLNAVGTAAVVTAEKVTLLKGAMNLLGGPIGIVTMLLTAGAYAWWQWGRSAQEAADKARDSVRRVRDEMATLEDVQTLNDRKKALRENLKNKDVQILVEGKNGVFAGKLKAERQAIIAELATIDKDIAGATAQGEETAIKDSVSAIQRRAERLISAKLASIKAAHNKELEAYDLAFKAGKLSKDEKAKKDLAALKKSANDSAAAEIAIWQKTVGEIAAAKKKIEDGKTGNKKGDARYRGFERQENEARERLAIAKENATHASKIGTAPDYVLTSNSDKAGAAKENKRIDLLEQLNATSKKLVAEILSGDTEKAVKILDLLENSGDYSANPKQRDAIEKKAKEVDALTDYKKAIFGVAGEIDSAHKKIVGMKADLAGGQPAAAKFGEAIRQLIEDLPRFKDSIGAEEYKAISEHLKKMAASAKEAENELSAVGQQTAAKGLLEKAQSQFNGLQESVSGGSSAIRKMRDEIQGLLATTSDPAAKEALQKALNFTGGSQGIEDGKHLREALKVRKDFAAKAAQIRADLVGDEKASMKLAHDAEILESNAALELRRQNGEFGIANDSAAYKEALAGLVDWQKALTEKLAEASKSPLEKMTDEWKKTYKQLEQLEANWANGFTDTLHDALTTGEADWKGYVLSVANDLSKMMLKNTMADGMNAVMGGVGGFLKGQISDKSPGAGESVVSGVLGGLKKLWGSLTGTSDAANSAAAAVGESTLKTVASTLASGTKMSAEVMAVSATQALAMSAVAAANALRGITGAGGSSGISLSGMMGGLAGNFSTAASYGTDMFSQQTAMLAAQDSFAEGGSSLLGDFGSWIGSFFAKGGIMTPSGSMPLRAYSTGGIANSPQLAMFGEGRTPEAYVPLPDGKSIPVTMTGGGSGTSQNIVISIVVNKDGKTDTNSTGADAGAWKKMADRVKGVVREELATQTRPGGMLYN